MARIDGFNPFGQARIRSKRPDAYKPVVMQIKLLLVEDDPVMQATLARTLGRRGFDVRACGNARAALLAWSSMAPDVVVLDLSLPDLDGLEVLQRARQTGASEPVLILTARGTVGDRVVGLNAGADDYLPKPFDLDELEARVRALARRRGNPAPDGVGPSAAPSTQLGALRLDGYSGAVYCREAVMDLTPRELALLQALLGRPGQALTKERLFERVFPGETDVHPEAIEVVVYRLRKKLIESGTQLVTLRGLGYLLRAES